MRATTGTLDTGSGHNIIHYSALPVGRQRQMCPAYNTSLVGVANGNVLSILSAIILGLQI